MLRLAIAPRLADVQPQLKPKASTGAPGAGLRDRNARMMSGAPPSRQRFKHAPGNFCARYVARGKTRCNLHGGKSTGPRKPARLTPERGRRRWVKGLKATGQKVPCGGDFTKSAKEKAERARLHVDRARKANEAMFRADAELVAKAFDRLAEATMRLAEATYLERLARPGDFAAWAAAERKRRGLVRLYARALFAVECIPAELRIDGEPSAKRPPHTVRVLYVRT
jgi:hypothetical protein